MTGRSLWPTAALWGLVLLVLLGTAAVFAVDLSGATAAPERTALGDQTALTSDETIGEYEQEGVVTVEPAQLDLTITVAERDADVGLDGLRSDVRWTFVRVQYREEIPREVQFNLPDAYARPRVHEGMQAVNSDLTATLRPTPDRSATSVTVTFDGSETAVFALGVERGAVSEWRAWSREQIANETGVDLPTLSSSGQWQRVGEQWANGTVALPAGTTVQYDATATPDSRRWVDAPPCTEQTTPVCTLPRDDAVVVVSGAETPPPVRYSRGEPGIVSRVSAAVADARQVPARIMEDIRSLLEGIV